LSDRVVGGVVLGRRDDRESERWDLTECPEPEARGDGKKPAVRLRREDGNAVLPA
jgi:hypothetical protein